jgi:hypothetical protein
MSVPLAENFPQHPVALLLVDVINDFDFPEGEALAPYAERAAPRIQAGFFCTPLELLLRRLDAIASDLCKRSA